MVYVSSQVIVIRAFFLVKQESLLKQTFLFHGAGSANIGLMRLLNEEAEGTAVRVDLQHAAEKLDTLCGQSHSKHFTCLSSIIIIVMIS